MPNFFRDTNQVEASERPELFKRLLASQCSPHLHLYICELLAPVCPESPDAARRFQVYPCKSFCRRLRQDCAYLIDKNDYVENFVEPGIDIIQAAFACDQLPYESNGGGGTDHGPCLEMPPSAHPAAREVPLTATASNPHRVAVSTNTVYRPYQPSLDPAIMSDSSNRIDASRVRPPNLDLMAHANAHLADKTLWEQTKLAGQQITWLLIRYSNALSLITIVVLLLVLSLNRLKRVKLGCGSMLTFGGKQSKSRAPTRDSCPPLAPFPISPSSSSRSLMVSADSSGKRPPYHQLICDPHDGCQMAAKYLRLQKHQQQLDSPRHPQDYHQHHQQVFTSNTSDGQSIHSNHYDYIAPPRQATLRPGEAANKQAFSNILLSSPSQQVLLLDAEPPSAGRARPGQQQQPPPPQPPPARNGNTRGVEHCAVYYHYAL